MENDQVQGQSPHVSGESQTVHGTQSFDHMPVHHTSYNRDEAQLFNLNGSPVVAMPQGWKVEVLSSLADHKPVSYPPYIEAKIIVEDDASFIRYFSVFSGGASMLFANRSVDTVECVFDYHTMERADMCKHRLIRKYAYDSMFSAWRDAAQRPMSQKAFATFLQDHLEQVSTEQRAALAASIASFKLAVNMKYSREDNLTNGDVRFTFVKESGQQGATLPELLTILTPIFEFGVVYEIRVRLSYNVDANAGVVTFKMELVQIEQFIDEAFRAEVSQLSAEIGKPILLTTND